MAKLKDAHISQIDLVEYLETSSDFAFELRCLERLTLLGFECQHGGSYTDPVTQKTRQFDIRAQQNNERLRIRCAIECKNLTESFPLLVMCVPRPENESFHDLILSYHPDNVEQSSIQASAFAQKCETHRIDAPHSAYTVGKYVGKSCVQVGRTLNDSITSNDAKVFDKWSQALASADDLADYAARDGEEQNDICLCLVLPILVVPDGMLWQTNYASDGTRCGDPVQTDRCSFYVGQYYATGFLKHTSLTLSHLEFVTLSGLENLLSNLLVKNNSWFPVNELFGE